MNLFNIQTIKKKKNEKRKKNRLRLRMINQIDDRTNARESGSRRTEWKKDRRQKTKAEGGNKSVLQSASKHIHRVWIITWWQENKIALEMIGRKA